MTYTLVAYRSDGERTCRGLHMESWSSDFIHEVALTRDQLVQRVADLRALEGREKYADILWFEDRTERIVTGDHDEDEVYVGPDESIGIDADRLVPAIRQAAKDLAVREQQQAAARQRAETERQERAAYETLRRKFEST